MKSNSPEKQQLSGEILSVGKRRVLAGMLAFSAFVAGAGQFEKGIDYFKQIPAADKQELESKTTVYTVEESGSLWNIAASLSVEDATYAVDVLEDLNPEFNDSRVVPTGTVLIVPRKYVTHESSVDLDSNSATIVKQ